MEFGNLLRKALPWIGAAATGNIPVLVGMAAKEIGDVLGIEVAATPEAMEKAVANATPEQLQAMQDRDYTFQERMKLMGYQHIEEMGRQSLAETTSFIEDTAKARIAHQGDQKVFVLGCIILGSFFIIVIAVLVLCGLMVSGTIKADPGTIAVVAGLIGTVVGYFAANAQQVVSYFFGSSKGSKDSGQSIRDSLTEALKQLGTKVA